MVELLIVVAVLGILTSVAVPNMLHARKRAEVTALVTEARTFQEALLRYQVDFGAYPTMAEFDTKTLEPLIRLGYLESSSFLAYCRGDQIHDYQTHPGDADEPLQWHVHPKIRPYDKGRQNMRIEGDGSSLAIKYLGQWFDTTTIMPLVR